MGKELNEGVELNGVKLTPEIFLFIKMTQADNGAIFECFIESVRNVLFYAIKQSIEDGVFESIQGSTVDTINFLDELKAIRP